MFCRRALFCFLTLLLLFAMHSSLESTARAQDAPAEEAAPAAATETAPPKETAAEATPAPTMDVPSLQDVSYGIDNLLLFVCAVLVIFMQAGFALVEVGLNHQKNAVNICFKNLIDFCLGVLLFWAVGFGLMYPGADYAGKYFGFGGYGWAMPTDLAQKDIDAGFVSGALRPLNPQVNFLFQVAFAATAATIVSGAVAGRIKFTAYIIYTAIITGLIYPVSGMWKWGGGWLNTMGFVDFAGSLVVHACGGFAGLAGAICLGPRLGKFTSDGRSVALPGHNLVFATLGVFILMIGWYGFNPGSQLAFSGQANINAVMLIAVNTTLAGCAGGCVAMTLTWLIYGKPDLSMALNGVLGGLVGITANCHCVTNLESVYIGAIAAPLVLAAVVMLEKCRIDDPVGAFPVHGVCGTWAGIATGIFGNAPNAEGVETISMKAQLIGSGAIIAWSFVTMMIVFGALRVIGQLRVTPEEETVGLDISEHGMEAYARG